MTIASRINILFLVAAVLMGLAATITTATREYDIQLQALSRAVKADLLSYPELQIHLYNRDQARLEATLQQLLEPAAAQAAIAYSSLGEELARRERGAATINAFDSVRDGLMAVDSGLIARDDSGERTGTGLLASLRFRHQPMYLSAPVFTNLNPAQLGHRPQDFYKAMAAPERPGLLQVIGYVHVVLDRSQLLRSTLPAAQRVLFSSALLIILLGIGAWFLSRQITRPLTQLAALADEVASGKLEKPVEIQGSGEIRDIAQVLNSVLGGYNRDRREHDINRRLLNMKVEERSSQLSQRELELELAARDAASTRDRLQQVSNYDGLTSLPNRHLFTEKLDPLLRLGRRNGQQLALLLIDLDDFKRINDSLGMDAGDQLLQEVAGRLLHCVRESDVIGHLGSPDLDIRLARLGGDEFTVVLNEIGGRDSAALVARRVISTLAEPMNLAGHELKIKASIGIALAPVNGDSVEHLLKAAGSAKYHAKSNEDSSFEFYNEDLGSAGAERMKLESELRGALSNGQLNLHYQPQVDTRSGSVAGAEALLRWDHPELGQVPPARFIPLAEEAGLIDVLGDWVLEEACRQLQKFDQAGLELPRIAINVSAKQFSARFVQRVVEVLDESGLPPARLELGLAESILGQHRGENTAALQQLSELGVYLSVDDFGSGQSALGYLANSPLHEIKLDRNFLLEGEQGEQGGRLLSAIIAMAKSLELQLLVEGIESEQQLMLVCEQGATLVQGYLFSAAVPAAELEPMLAPWHFMEQIQSIQQRAELSPSDRFIQDSTLQPGL